MYGAAGLQISSILDRRKIQQIDHAVGDAECGRGKAVCEPGRWAGGIGHLPSLSLPGCAAAFVSLLAPVTISVFQE